jgi:hypothetical protein
VYHNIPGDRQAYLLETLRTLKKGGSFAIHDIMSTTKYGDMQAFAEKLRDKHWQPVDVYRLAGDDPQGGSKCKERGLILHGQKRFGASEDFYEHAVSRQGDLQAAEYRMDR